MTLVLLILLVPPIPSEIPRALALPTLSVESPTLSHLNAAQERLQLNGKRILPLVALQHSQLTQMSLPRLETIGLLGQPLKAGPLLHPIGHALVAPLSGPIVLARTPVMVSLSVRLLSLEPRRFPILLSYGTQIIELFVSIIMAPVPVPVTLEISPPRPLGTPTPLSLQFLFLNLLARLMKIMVILVVPVVVIVLEISRVLDPSLPLPPLGVDPQQFRVHAILVLSPISLLQVPLSPAGPTMEELVFRKCGDPVTLLTMVTPRFPPRGRTPLLPPRSITEFLVTPWERVRRVLILNPQLPPRLRVGPDPRTRLIIPLMCPLRTVLLSLLLPIVVTTSPAPSGFEEGTLRLALHPRLGISLIEVF